MFNILVNCKEWQPNYPHQQQGFCFDSCWFCVPLNNITGKKHMFQFLMGYGWDDGCVPFSNGGRVGVTLLLVTLLRNVGTDVLEICKLGGIWYNGQLEKVWGWMGNCVCVCGGRWVGWRWGWMGVSLSLVLSQLLHPAQTRPGVDLRSRSASCF